MNLSPAVYLHASGADLHVRPKAHQFKKLLVFYFCTFWFAELASRVRKLYLERRFEIPIII